MTDDRLLHPAYEQELRRRRQIGALGLIGFGVFALVVQTFGLGQFFLLGLGLAFMAGYFSRTRPSNLIVPGGLLTGLGAAVLLTSGHLLPHGLVAPIFMASFALGFGLIYAFGEPRHKWAKGPAAAFAVLSAIALSFAAPWHFFGNWWPLLLVLVGVYLMRRERRWA